MYSNPRPLVLIQTGADDLHALIVELALGERGHRVLRHFGADLPQHAAVELRFGGDKEARLLHNLDGSIDLDEVAVLWNRRPYPPAMPPVIDPLDRHFVSQQNLLAAQTLSHFSEACFAINPTHAARRADCKAVQAHYAPRCGLRIPPTLISNQPEAIRQFIDGHERVIHKPLQGAVWKEDGSEYGSYTARVCADDLPEDALLRCTPAIFQTQVPKQFEVRAQFWGRTCLAARIESQAIDYGEFDWRLHQGAGVQPSVIEVPAAIQAACVSLMRALGLVAGAFDFIVTPEGEWVFLEVNEAGQFIFLEQWCPELPVLDALCGFILAADPDYQHRLQRNAMSMNAVLDRYPVYELLERDRARRRNDQPIELAA